MILSIVGALWILFGIWWCLRPASGKRALRTKFVRTLRFLLAVVLWTIGGALIAAGRELPGIYGWIVPAVGILALLKGLLFVRRKALDKVLDWWEKQPDWMYRLAGGVFLILGVALNWMSGTWSGD